MASISLALVVVERLLGGGDLAAEHDRDPLELARGLRSAIAEVGDPDLGRGHRFGGGAQLRLQLRLLARAGAQRLGYIVLSAPAQHPSLERRGSLAGGVATVCGGLAEIGQSSEQHGLALDPLGERILAAAAEQVLDPACGPARPLRRLADPGDLGNTIPVGGSRAGRLERGPCKLERRGDSIEPGAHRVVAGAGTGRRGQVLGERPEGGAAHGRAFARARGGGRRAPRPER